MEILLNILLLLLILGGSAMITQWFARTMYKHCPQCASLNARRRTHCRVCGLEIIIL